MNLEIIVGFLVDAVVKNLPASIRDTRDTGSIPESGRSPEVGKGIPFQDSMDRGAWGAIIHGGCKELDMSEHIVS